MADASRELNIVISAKDEASKVLNGFKDKMSDVGADIKKGALALVGLGAATGFVAKGFIDAAGEMQATKTAFNVLIGNSQLAEATLKDLFALESKTPFTLESVLSESKKLLAMGTDAKDLTKTLTMLGDVASGVGFEKLPQLTLAFGQIQAKGRLMGTELRQLTEAGFNLAEAMGVSSTELDVMISKGEVGFEDVRAAFEKVTGEGGRFNGLMAALAETTPGRLSTLESSIYKLKVALGEALLPTFNLILDKMLPLVDSFAAWAKEHQNIVAIAVILAVALGVIGVIVLTLITVITGLIAVLGALGAVFTAVGVVIGTVIAILGGPLTLAVLAVIAIVAALALAWKNNWFNIQGIVQNAMNWFKNTVVPFFDTGFGKAILSILDAVSGGWVSRFGKMRDAVNWVIDAVKSLISAAQDLANKAAKGLKIPGFQHGGFVPGGFSDAVPAILHGGERVVPRTGVDVNNSGGGGGDVTINFSGAVSMDSESRVQDLAERIVRLLGRQNELAAKGISI